MSKSLLQSYKAYLTVEYSPCLSDNKQLTSAIILLRATKARANEFNWI